jgi:hypothetical protein
MAINRTLSGEQAMATWTKCTTAEGNELRVNLDHVAMIRPHHSERSFSGSEIIFAAGNLSSIIVRQTQEELAEPPHIERGHDEV